MSRLKPVLLSVTAIITYCPGDTSGGGKGAPKPTGEHSFDNYLMECECQRVVVSDSARCAPRIALSIGRCNRDGSGLGLSVQRLPGGNVAMRDWRGRWAVPIPGVWRFRPIHGAGAYLGNQDQLQLGREHGAAHR